MLVPFLLLQALPNPGFSILTRLSYSINIWYRFDFNSVKSPLVNIDLLDIRNESKYIAIKQKPEYKKSINIETYYVENQVNKIYIRFIKIELTSIYWSEFF